MLYGGNQSHTLWTRSYRKSTGDLNVEERRAVSVLALMNSKDAYKMLAGKAVSKSMREDGGLN